MSLESSGIKILVEGPPIIKFSKDPATVSTPATHPQDWEECFAVVGDSNRAQGGSVWINKRELDALRLKSLRESTSGTS